MEVRYASDADAVEWLWMSARDIYLNMRDHGQHPELLKGLQFYLGVVMTGEQMRQAVSE